MLKTLQRFIANKRSMAQEAGDAWKQQGMAIEWITPNAKNAVFPKKGTVIKSISIIFKCS